jgi:ABC-type nitrate/sulfonate/bicarbonate transport system substrate-binding protein
LDGVGLKVDDVEVNWMDQATSNASFLAGEGDAACVGGRMSFTDDKKDFVLASNGDMTQLGLYTNIMANPSVYTKEDVRTASKIFMKVFFDTVDWIHDNPDESEKYLIDWCDYAGSSIDAQVAKTFLSVDKFYTLEENYKALHAPAGDGGKYCKIQEDIKNILQFFIDCGNYQKGDDEKLLQSKHIDTSLVDELFSEIKK